MNNSNYFKEIFESITDYRKIVLLIVSIQNDKYLLREVGFSERDINLLNKEFENKKIEQHEKYLDCVKIKKRVLLKGF